MGSCFAEVGQARPGRGAFPSDRCNCLRVSLSTRSAGSHFGCSAAVAPSATRRGAIGGDGTRDSPLLPGGTPCEWVLQLACSAMAANGTLSHAETVRFIDALNPPAWTNFVAAHRLESLLRAQALQQQASERTGNGAGGRKVHCPRAREPRCVRLHGGAGDRRAPFHPRTHRAAGDRTAGRVYGHEGADRLLAQGRRQPAAAPCAEHARPGGRVTRAIGVSDDRAAVRLRTLRGSSTALARRRVVAALPVAWDACCGR